MYPSAFKLAASAAHGLTAALCLGVWGRSVASSPPPLAGHYVPRIVRGFVGSLTNLMPNPMSRVTGDTADDPDTVLALHPNPTPTPTPTPTPNPKPYP